MQTQSYTFIFTTFDIVHHHIHPRESPIGSMREEDEEWRTKRNRDLPENGKEQLSEIEFALSLESCSARLQMEHDQTHEEICAW